jgi:hypothetical protein
VTTIDNRTAFESLKSNKCPACGEWKMTMQTLCRSEYYKLPKTLGDNLYAGIGSGYSEALAEALKFLGVDEPKF